jgi:hypothetical protein
MGRDREFANDGSRQDRGIGLQAPRMAGAARLSKKIPARARRDFPQFLCLQLR